MIYQEEEVEMMNATTGISKPRVTLNKKGGLFIF